jgi:hypothetical protein
MRDEWLVATSGSAWWHKKDQTLKRGWKQVPGVWPVGSAWAVVAPSKDNSSENESFPELGEERYPTREAAMFACELIYG